MNVPSDHTPSAGRPLPADFFLGSPDEVARGLLGALLFRRFRDGSVAAGRIVETEAYSEEDPASHSYPGPTARNAPMYGPGGTTYVYLIYGIHHCFNVVTGPAGEGSAVLVRGILPTAGIALMRQRRGTRVPEKSLCDGPGKICRALDLDRTWNGHTLREPPLQILEGAVTPEERHIRITPRIGITKNADQLRRFLWDYENHNFS